MIDPYTGESLGGDEEKIGTVKVSRVESKFSVATILEGTGFEAGMIARSAGPGVTHARPKLASPAPASSTKAATGYKLPFDR